MLQLHLHILVCITLFFIGICGVLVSRRNLILTFMSLELMIISSSLLLTFASIYLDDLMGQVFVLYILATAAAETAVGLCLIAAYYRERSLF